MEKRAREEAGLPSSVTQYRNATNDKKRDVKGLPRHVLEANIEKALKKIDKELLSVSMLTNLKFSEKLELDFDSTEVVLVTTTDDL